MTTDLNALREQALAAEQALKTAVPKAIGSVTSAITAERRARTDITLPGAAQSVQGRQARQAGLDAIAESQLVAQRAQDAITEFVDKASGSWATGGGTEAELARQAAWARVKPSIGTDFANLPASISKAVNEAVRTGDTPALEAIRREAPAHAQACGAPLPAEIIKSLDLTAGSPVAVHARQMEEASAHGSYRVAFALGLLSDTLEREGDLPGVVPSYEPNLEYHAAPRSVIAQAVTT